MTIEEIAAMEGSYLIPTFVPGEYYAFWDGDSPDKYVIAKYSHSEKTTPIDRHWTKDMVYYHHVAPVVFSVLMPEGLKMLVSPWEKTKEIEILAPEHSS